MNELDAMIDSLREIGRADFGGRIASRAAPLIEAGIQKTLGAGTSPEGTPWAPKKEGGRAYQNAASRISVASFGDLILGTLTGPEVYGHFGARGMPIRQMIPDTGADIPASLSEPLTKATEIVMNEVTR